MKTLLPLFILLVLAISACKSAQPAPDHDKVEKAYQEYKQTEEM